MHYSVTGFIPSDVIKFYSTQIDEIEPSIQKTLDFIEYYKHIDDKKADYGKQKENIKIFCIACLPFLIAKFKIQNPNKEDRAFKKKTLEWLKYIKHNQGIANHNIHSISSDDSITIIKDDRLNKQIELHEWYLTAKKTIKRENWSGVLQFLCLARSLDIVWKKQEGKILDFLYRFITLFIDEINTETIQKQMLIESRYHPIISFSKEHIQKVLALPKNRLTQYELETHHLNSLKDSLL